MIATIVVDSAAEEVSRVFEIHVPLGPGAEEQVRQLGRLAAELGLPIVERPSDEVITPIRLQLLATEMWQRPGYGTCAASLLQELQAGVSRNGKVVEGNGMLYVVAPTFGLFFGRNGTPFGSADLPTEEIDQGAQTAFANSEAPFLIVTTPVETRQEGRRVVRQVTALAPTQSRLSRFAQVRGYGTHTLHGAVGKTLDVLAAAAGIKPATRSDSREWQGDFVTRKEFVAVLRSVGVTPAQMEVLLQKIAYGIDHQLWHGTAPEFGEVVIEGNCHYQNAGDGPFVWDRLALDSIPGLASSYRGRSGMADLLPGFRQLYDRWKVERSPAT